VTDRIAKAFYASCALLVAANLVGNLWLTPALYVPANVTMLALLLWVAGRAGAGADDLGLRRLRVRRGLAVGAAVAAVVVIFLVVAAILPETDGIFDDQRAGMSRGLLLYHALLRIPLGTAVFEEVAFRGVLYGLGKRLWSAPRAAWLSATLFGLWHIAPSLTVVDANAAVAANIVPGLAMIGLVLSALVVGLFLTWVRDRADSLVAPIVVHAIANSVALVIAYQSV
jgi:membrane protease YdiL (CAAX protease family)